MGISYHGRTYEEGKKIGVRDGFRALYCIFHYNAFRAPLPIQLAIYAAIGAIAGVINLSLFSALAWSGMPIEFAIILGFATGAAVNYILCILILFRRGARWKPTTEMFFYLLAVMCIGAIDFSITKGLMAYGLSAFLSRCCGAVSVFLLNFVARRFIVFPERRHEPWHRQEKTLA
jgi:putative flippase GtrA